jgi:site-specific DNA recombinase
LQLLLAEEDNINRSIKIRGGIYTAKAKEGRYVSRNIPFGYKMEGERKQRKLTIDEPKAKIVHFIFDSFLRNVPLYLIKEQARKLGFKTKGNSAVEKLLSKPIYAGLLEVAAFKEYPGGLFPGMHEPIVDITSWRLVQEKLKQPEQAKVIVDDELPLRGVLKCHCGIPLTGAPSRGNSGKYFYYYKCRQSKHNNSSVIKANAQLMAALGLISLPLHGLTI